MGLKIKNNYGKELLMFMIILWMIITYLALSAFNSKDIINSSILKNSIKQNTTFSFMVEAKPSSLYPKGGLIKTNDFIFTKLTKSIKLHINSSITSNKAINVSGIKKVSLQLVADPYWKKDYILAAESKFNLNGSKIEIFNNDYEIDLTSLLEFAQKVEIETGTRSDKYLFKIKPEVTGKILDQENELPIYAIPEISIQYGANQIQIIGNSEYSKLNNIQKTDIIKQKYNIFGASITLNLARYLLSFLSLIIIIFSIYVFKRLNLKTKHISENDLIYNKYIDRIIPLKEDLDKKITNFIKIGSLKSLTKISNEKELPIFSFSDDEKLLNLYIIDNKYVYGYEIK